jgi:hypothetical protein
MIIEVMLFREMYDELNDSKKTLIRDKFCKDFNVTKNTFLNRISDKDPCLNDYIYFSIVFGKLEKSQHPSSKAIPLEHLVNANDKKSFKQLIKQKMGIKS